MMEERKFEKLKKEDIRVINGIKVRFFDKLLELETLDKKDARFINPLYETLVSCDENDEAISKVFDCIRNENEHFLIKYVVYGRKMQALQIFANKYLKTNTLTSDDSEKKRFK